MRSQHASFLASNARICSPNHERPAQERSRGQQKGGEMFVVDRNNELVGYSEWPWDSLYAPVVGCFVDGRLQAIAVCDHEPQQKVRIGGPPHRIWFRMRVRTETREALEAGDKSAVLLRLEDGAPVPRVGQDAEAEQRLRSVEEIVSRAPAQQRVPLDGFETFIGAPASHRLDVTFLDYLNRLPDPVARVRYLDQMEQGMSILQVRNDVMNSEEFRERGLTISDRIGALITSPMWRTLEQFEPLGERRPRVREIRMSDYADMSDLDFVSAFHVECHGDEASEATRVGLAGLASARGRAIVASLFIRDAANGGQFLRVID